MTCMSMGGEYRKNRLRDFHIFSLLLKIKRWSHCRVVEYSAAWLGWDWRDPRYRLCSYSQPQTTSSNTDRGLQSSVSQTLSVHGHGSRRDIAGKCSLWRSVYDESKPGSAADCSSLIFIIRNISNLSKREGSWEVSLSSHEIFTKTQSLNNQILSLSTSNLPPFFSVI